MYDKTTADFLNQVEELKFSDEEKDFLAKEDADKDYFSEKERAELIASLEDVMISPPKYVYTTAFKKEKKDDSFLKVEKVFKSMANLIKVKNSRYGNSVMEPLGIFNKHVKADNEEALNGILVRLDDKLKRIKNSDQLRKNDVSDLIGYLAFLCANKGWTDFADLID
jgi:hypothetical protein